MIEIKYLTSSDVKQLNCAKVVRFSQFRTYTDGVNKMVLMSITNLFAENLTAITFKITQYDEENNRLKREVKTLTDLSIRHKRTYDVDELCKVDVLMDHCEVEIISLTYVTIAYESGTISSTFIKEDKAFRRHIKKLNRKKSKKKKPKIKKKDLKDVVSYSLEKEAYRKAMWIAVFCGAVMILGIVIVASFLNKVPSSISWFHAVALNLFKGGLL